MTAVQIVVKAARLALAVALVTTGSILVAVASTVMIARHAQEFAMLASGIVIATIPIWPRRPR